MTQIKSFKKIYEMKLAAKSAPTETKAEAKEAAPKAPAKKKGK